MRAAFNIVALIACILANTIPRWTLGISGDEFCKWQALSFAFMAIAAIKKSGNCYERVLWDYTLIVALANAIDEWMHLAEQVRIGEIVFGTLVTLWTIYRLTKCRLNHNT